MNQGTKGDNRMKLSESVKPISYFKAHAARIIKDLSENNPVMVITQNGEATAVVQDIRTYEKIQESLALLKILARSRKNLQNGNIRSAEEILKDLEDKIRRDL